MVGEPLFIRPADHGARILVVDADPLARRSLRAMLERGYYQVETVEGGAEALAILPSFKPDLVVLDIQMPGWMAKRSAAGSASCRRVYRCPSSS